MEPVLPRDLTVLLIQLSVSLNKSRSYPAGHPVLVAGMEILAQHLDTILQRQEQFQLTIGITRTQLLMDGLPSDARNPVLRDLAERLHHHQLAAIQFLLGVPIEELTDLIAALAAETWRQGQPLGLEPVEQLLSRWPHVSVEPLPLDQLALGESAGAQLQSERIWQGMVNAVLVQAEAAGGGPAGNTAELSGADLANAVRARRGDVAYDRAVMGWMLQMGEHLGEESVGSPLRQKVSEMFAALDPPTLASLLKGGATPEERRRLLLSGSRNLPVAAVLDLLHAASSESDTPPSPALMRIMGKLVNHAGAGRGKVVPGAEDVLRDVVRRLVNDWDMADPSSLHHRRLLELLAKPGTYIGSDVRGKTTSGALRLVQMGLELGVSAPVIDEAVTELAGSTDLASLLAMQDQAEAAGLDPAPLWPAIIQPAMIRDAMLDDKSDIGRLEQILDRIGTDAVHPLLDALELVESTSRRRWVMTRLEGLGGEIGPLLVASLPGKPWYVIRNILSLLGSLPRLPEGFVPEPYTGHEDPRVRREAFKLQFVNPGWRAGAIMKAVADPDATILRLALATAGTDCPPELPLKLLELMRHQILEPQDRAIAIRLLGKSPTRGIRDWLLSQVATQHGLGWFRWTKLHAKSPEMLASLAILSAHFARQPEVAKALELAKHSNDPDVRMALRGQADG